MALAEMRTDLNGMRVLVVEDDYFLASDHAMNLVAAGAEVIGPVGTIDDAIRLLMDNTTRIDWAILDINLHGDMVYPVADVLIDHGVPITFATGYDARAIADRYCAVPRIEKPFNIEVLLRFVPLPTASGNSGGAAPETAGR